MRLDLAYHLYSVVALLVVVSNGSFGQLDHQIKENGTTSSPPPANLSILPPSSANKCQIQNDTLSSREIIIGYLTAVNGNQRGKQGRGISGAIMVAIDEINNSTDVLPNVTIGLRWNDTQGDMVLSAKQMTEMICDDVNAVFGPEGSCYVEAIMGQSRNISMFSYRCSDYKISAVPTFIRTDPPDTQISKSVIALMSHYKWNKFSVIYEEAMATVADSLLTLAKEMNMTINHDKMLTAQHLCCQNHLDCCYSNEWYNLIEETMNATRIYVFIGTRISLVHLLTNMHALQLLENGEYFVVFVDNFYSKKDIISYLFKWDYYIKYDACDNLPDYRGYLKRGQSLFVIIPTPPVDEYNDFVNKVRRYNLLSPFLFQNHPVYQHLETEVTIYAAYLYDSVHLYAYGLNELLLEHDNLTDAQFIEIIHNGAQIAQKIIDRGVYKSITGAMIKLDKNGDSEGNYSVLALQLVPEDSNHTIDGSKFKCNYKMMPVGQFFQNGTTDMPIYKIHENISIDWIGDDIPKDEPKCGFNNERCPKPNTQTLKIIVAGTLGILLFCASVIIMSIYRKWKIEQEIEGLLWKIDVSEINRHMYFNRDQSNSPSRISLASTSMISYESRGGMQVFATTAIYKNLVVRIKELNFSRKKDISRDIMKEMRILRDLRHDNVNSFIGACVEPTSTLLITDYCAKGSLYDIIENEDIKLDKMFVASLVHDLIKGMLYLHNSALLCHGNLKSSNCVVTSRWVLQVSDFGLAELQCDAENDSIGDHQYYRGLFWKAPEILRHPQIYLRGTKSGDVYAFGIILYELLTRRAPYSSTGYEPKEIIDMVKQEVLLGQESFRPDLEVLLDCEYDCPDYVVQCMTECWSEVPEVRPNFITIRGRLKGMKDGKHKNIMDQMMDMMVTYANNLEELVTDRTRLLCEEKMKTEDLLHRMLPRSVAERLTKGYGVEPEYFDLVTIYFSDIVGFTAMSAESTPLQVVNFLNDLYTVFDRIIKGYEVYKVETIGDAYMVVSGLPIRNSDRHAGEIASMALELLNAVKNHSIAHRPNETLKLRIGIHTGPVVAGVVGLTMPRYCLFGDTVNTASRMESNGEPLKIHISFQCRQALEKLGGYTIDERGLVNLKGKGQVKTFWLVGATEKAIQKRDVDFGEIPPLFCRPRRSPRLTSDSRQTSQFGMNRRFSNVPKDFMSGSKLSLTSSTICGSQNIDYQSNSQVPVKHALSSIESGSIVDEIQRHNSQSAVAKVIHESKSLDSLMPRKDLVPARKNRRRYSMDKVLHAVSNRFIPSFSRSKSIHRSFDEIVRKKSTNCSQSSFQIIAIPDIEEERIPSIFQANGSFKHTALPYSEDFETPLLNKTKDTNAVILRRRGGTDLQNEQLQNSTSKRWHSLEAVTPFHNNEDVEKQYHTAIGADNYNKKDTPRSVKDWLVGLFNGSGYKSSSSSLLKRGSTTAGGGTKVFNSEYNNIQSERESVV